MDSASTPPTRGPRSTPRILIIGAGITGLLFAQSLRKRHAVTPALPTPKFDLFERDPTPSFRGAGWGLTIHWALKDFTSLLPQYLVDRLPETFVDAEAMEKGEKGNFLLYDLQTGEEKYRVPPNERIRVSRERLRALLMDGLDIQWSKNLIAIEQSEEDMGITARFEDGTSTTGTLLIGADGSRSQVRKIISPASYQNNLLPVRLLGVSVPYSKARCNEIRKLDPFFFQASDPSTNTFLWFSFLKTPVSTAEGSDTDCTCQILTSWPYRPGFRGKETPIEVPETNEERVSWMRELARGWTEPFASTVLDIPEGTDVKTIDLEDWPPTKGLWDNYGGKVTLVGDAAHAMTMFRGEAANHGIADIASLYKELFEQEEQETKAVDRYENEMIPRAKTAVLNSRQACMDAHDYQAITEKSPLVARRVIVLEN